MQPFVSLFWTYLATSSSNVHSASAAARYTSIVRMNRCRSFFTAARDYPNRPVAELWHDVSIVVRVVIPAEELEELNDNIVGLIEVIGEHRLEA